MALSAVMALAAIADGSIQRRVVARSFRTMEIVCFRRARKCDLQSGRHSETGEVDVPEVQLRVTLFVRVSYLLSLLFYMLKFFDNVAKSGMRLK